MVGAHINANTKTILDGIRAHAPNADVTVMGLYNPFPTLVSGGDALVGRLLTYDSLKMKFRELKLRRDPNCIVCGPNPTITKYIDYEGFCALPG